MMKKIFFPLLILASLLAITFQTAQAQSAGELKLSLSRDFGYGGFGGDIQGTFTMKISNPPADLIKVVFLIDGNTMGEDVTPPFSLTFNTDSYPLGSHTLSATGYTSAGAAITSNLIQPKFVPASEGTKIIVKIVLPIVLLVVLMIVVTFALPLIQNKGKLSSIPLGSQRKYGIGGGAICPKCGRPFPLRLWWINLGLSKIDRCPYCGKWSLVRPRSLAELRAAEATELSQSQQGQAVGGETDEEKLKKELDDSRFQES